ncbi:MAG: ectonucleotide pyrophosphatase/phosphodiesterase [Bacteroidota bacterium]
MESALTHHSNKQTRIAGRLWLLFLVASSLAEGQQANEVRRVRPTVILISIDGFRNDYLENTTCPNLRRLASEGVRAQWMIPVFPSKTFPNHYSIVTGLYAENHGVVGNTMYDPVFDVVFTMRKREEVVNSRWWGGEPIWATAEKQGQVSATYFWPGSEALIATKRPSHWLKYDGSVPYGDRVRQVLNWIDYPEGQRPTLISLYFEEVDHAGHDYGPIFSAVDTAVKTVDAALGMLVNGLEDRGLLDEVNIIVVSDHGMAPVEKSRTIWLDDYLSPDSVSVVDWGIVVSLWPREDRVDEVFHSVAKAHPRMKAYRKHEIPDRWHYRNNRRIAPILLVADEGWTIARKNGGTWRRSDNGGNHGFDNQSVSMRALFVARGPAFRSGIVLGPFENVNVYSLMTHLLSLAPAPNDGTFRVFDGALR